MVMSAHTFEAGQTYRATSICDSECHWYFTIERRTAGSIWTTIDGVHVRRVVKSTSISGDIEEYFETESGAVAWAKEGNIPSVEFYTDNSVSDEDKLDDLTVGNLMEYSSDL